MSISEDFRTYLKTQSTITSVVGSRIVQAPAQMTTKLPMICYRRGNALTDPVLNGGGGGLTETSFDVECRAATQDGAEDLSDALHTLLQATSNVTWGSSTAVGTFVESQADDYAFMEEGNDTPEYVVASLVRVFHR